MLPWCVEMSAVVQIGSTILRSECSATFKVDCASAGAANAAVATSAQARRRPIFSMKTPSTLPVAGTIGRSAAQRDIQQRLPIRHLHARAATGSAGRYLVLVDAMPACGIDGHRKD